MHGATCNLEILPSRGLFRSQEIEALSTHGVELHSPNAVWTRLEMIRIWSENKERTEAGHLMTTIFENKDMKNLSGSEVLYAANVLKLRGKTVRSMRLELQKKAKVGSIMTLLGSIPSDYPLVCDAEGLVRMHVFDKKDEECVSHYNKTCGFQLANNKTCQGTLILEAQFQELNP